MRIHTAGDEHTSRMPHMFSGLLSLLLDLALIWGPVAEGTLNISDDVAKNQQVSPANSHNVSQFSAHGIFLTESNNNNATHEDQESFQDQEKIHHYSDCKETKLIFCGNSICLESFSLEMKFLGQVNWCDWEMVLSSYNYLTTCMEECAALFSCYYPNAVVQDMFVDVHEQYFSLCGTEEEALPDAPARVVLVLTLLPVSVIPILVYMVIWKSSVID